MGEPWVDFLVEGKIPVELKAVIKLANSSLSQAKNYLEAYTLEEGLLLNFGVISLEFKRIGNAKFKDNPFPPNPKNPPNRGSGSLTKSYRFHRLYLFYQYSRDH